jgi:hypothetical protein
MVELAVYWVCPRGIWPISAEISYYSNDGVSHETKAGQNYTLLRKEEKNRIFSNQQKMNLLLNSAKELKQAIIANKIQGAVGSGRTNK